MGVFFGRAGRSAPERRYNGFTATFSSPPIPPPFGQGGSYASVDLSRAEASMQKVAVWSAVDLITSLVSSLPVDVYSGSGDTRREIPMPDWMKDPGGDGYGLSDWLTQYLTSHLLRGNVYGRVGEWSQHAYPTQVVLYHPDDVYGWRDRVTGLTYWRAEGQDVPATVMWHRRTHTIPGALLGASPVAYQAQAIGLGLAAQRFGYQFFSDGAHPSGMLTNDESLDKAQADTAKARFLAALRGSREPVVLGKGWKWQQLSIAPEESQFLETQKYSAAECARIFGPGIAEIMGYETGGTLTYSNPEGRSSDLLTYSLDKWITRVERDLSSMLPRPQTVKLNRAAIVRTDLLTRYKAHALAIASRFLAPSEARALEDMPPMTDAQHAELDTIPAPVLDPLKEHP